MDSNKDRKDGTTETSDDGSFDRVMNGTTALNEDQKALDALLSAKREMDVKVQEKVAHVKVQVLQVIEAAVAVLDRLPLADGIESLVLSRLRHRREEANCGVPPSRFPDGTRTEVTLMVPCQYGSALSGDSTRSIRYVCGFSYCPASTYQSQAFMAWGYIAKIEVRQTKELLAVYLVLQPGPNDSSLPWPFKKVFTLTLVHPMDGSRDVHYRCILPDTTDGRGPFQEPDDDDNVGCGTNDLCTMAFIKENGFLVKNCFCIRAEIFK